MKPSRSVGILSSLTALSLGCSNPQIPRLGESQVAQATSDPDLALWAPDQYTFRLPLETGPGVKQILEVDDPENPALFFSRSGKLLARHFPNEGVLAFASGATISLKAYTGTKWSGFSITRDEKAILVGRSAGLAEGLPVIENQLVDVESGEVILKQNSRAMNPTFQWARDRAYFSHTATESFPPIQRLFEVKPGEAPVELGPAGASDIKPFVWISPSGSKVAWTRYYVGSAESELYLLDVGSHTPRKVARLKDSEDFMKDAVWSTDEKSIGYISGVDGDFAVHRILLEEGVEEMTPFKIPYTPPTERNAVPNPPRASHLSPDLSKCLVYAFSPLYIRDLRTGQHTQITTRPATPIRWTADGKAIIVAVHNTYHGRTRYYRIAVAS